MSGFFDNIVGNDSLRKRLGTAILYGSFSHSYIIEGAQGSGRKTLARSIAAALDCERENGDRIPCGSCLACRKIFTDKTPDVIRIAPEKDRVTIGVETARHIQRDILSVPNDFKYKVYIIENADKMTIQAQNALLLTLEEPPEYAVFILICQAASALLDTVRSRAPVLRTERVTHELISEYLTTHDARAEQLLNESPREFAELLSASDGCIGQVLMLLDSEARQPVMARRQLARRTMEVFASSASSSDKYEVFSMFSSKREDVLTELHCISNALRDLAVLKKSATAPLIFWSERDTALDMSDKYSLFELILLRERIKAAAAMLEKNANLKLTLMNLVFASGTGKDLSNNG